MSILDALDTLNRRYAPGAIREAEDARWHDAGADLVDDAARDLGLRRRYALGDVGPPERRSILARLVVTGRSAFKGIGGLLASGASTVAGWYRAMREGIGPRTYAGVMALLGPGSLAPAARVDVRDALAVQVGYLDRFRGQVEGGEVRLRTADGSPSGGIGNRSANYASAVWASAMNMERLARIRDGFGEAIRMLGATEHCRECPALAALGWVDIASVVPIGDTVCRAGCDCHINYR